MAIFIIKIDQKWDKYSLEVVETSKNESSLPENIEIDTKIIQIDPIEAFL
jgi:hypothetical protein